MIPMRGLRKFFLILMAAVAFCAACTRFIAPQYPYRYGDPSRYDHPYGQPPVPVYSTSFFTGSDRHENGEGNNLKALLEKAVKEAEVTPSTVILNGDYVGAGRTPHPDFSVTSIYNEIDSVLNTNTTDVILGFGAHDTNCTDGYGVFLSGPHRCDGYYVYGVSFAQMKFATDSLALVAIKAGRGENGSRRGYRNLDTLDRRGLSAESGTRSFTEWVTSLPDRNPVVVITHMPLHAHRKDNLGATVWMDALKRAACYRDIIVLWGHNHTVEKGRTEEDIARNAAIERKNYLLAPGDSIYVQSPVDSVSVGDVVNFTYVNDGYITLGYASVVTFSDTRGDGRYDRLRIDRVTINPDDTLVGTFGDTRWASPYEATLGTKMSRVSLNN